MSMIDHRGLFQNIESMQLEETKKVKSEHIHEINCREIIAFTRDGVIFLLAAEREI